MKKRRRQSSQTAVFHLSQFGYSLLELLVASALVFFVLAVLLQGYQVSSRVARQQAGIADLQQRGSFALTYLAQRIAQAGLNTCVTPHQMHHDQRIFYHPPSKYGDVLSLNNSVFYQQHCLFRPVTYFVGKNHGLYFRPYHHAIELVPGVVALTLYYGIACGKNICAYLPADQVKNWQQVKSVDIDLLLASSTGLQRHWHRLVALKEIAK